jgi:Amidohydrolase family
VQSPLYADVTTFVGQAKYFYSHTPLVSGYGAWNEEYFWQESPIWQDVKQGKWTPWRQLIPHTRRFIQRPVTDYSKDIVSQQIADIVAAGGYSAVGSHGQQPGLGSHWDVWMAAKASGNMGALEIASMHGAKFLGMDQDIGSISVGKLADLMVLNGNPLDDIRQTGNIQYVMKAGTLYDAMSLDEVWPRQKRFGDTYWYVPEMYKRDTKAVGIYDRR